MATYDLNRTELNGVLTDQGIEASLRAKIIATLEEAGVYGGHGHDDDDDHGHGHGHDHDHGHGSPSEALTSIVHAGETASKFADVAIYADDVSGYVGDIPKDATAIIFASDNGVIAEIGGDGHKIVVSGDGNDVLTMTGTSSDEI